MRISLVVAAVLTAALMIPTPGLAAADDSRWEGGFRYSVLNGGGKPAADMPNLGLVGHYSFGSSWRIGFAVDKVEFDFEGPVEYLGLQQDAAVPTVDSKVSGVLVSAWARQDRPLGARRASWFWSAGLGVSSASAKDARGPLAGGGSFDVQTDTGTDFIATGAAGIRWRLSQNWRLDVAARVDHHLADWTIVDRVSGRTASVGSFTAPGAHVGFFRRF